MLVTGTIRSGFSVPREIEKEREDGWVVLVMAEMSEDLLIRSILPSDAKDPIVARRGPIRIIILYVCRNRGRRHAR